MEGRAVRELCELCDIEVTQEVLERMLDIERAEKSKTTIDFRESSDEAVLLVQTSDGKFRGIAKMRLGMFHEMRRSPVGKDVLRQWVEQMRMRYIQEGPHDPDGKSTNALS